MLLQYFSIFEDYIEIIFGYCQFVFNSYFYAKLLIKFQFH